MSQGSVSEISENLENLTASLFTIATLPKKGRCLIASTDISPGTLLLREKPLLVTPRDLSPAALETWVQMRLRDLPKTQQRQYLSVQNNFCWELSV